MTIFYDFNILPKKEIIQTLESFKFKGACIFYDSPNLNEKTQDKFNNLSEMTTLDIYKGIRIKEDNPNNLRKKIQKFSKKTDFIMVEGGDPKINRAACEMPQVTILSHPYLNHYNSGMNHILSRMACENNITINIDFKHILSNKGFYRAKLISQINQLLDLKRKYKFDVLLSSGSKNFYDVRSYEDMIKLSQLLTMTKQEAITSISKVPSKLIHDKTIKSNSIIDGVELIK